MDGKKIRNWFSDLWVLLVALAIACLLMVITLSYLWQVHTQLQVISSTTPGIIVIPITTQSYLSTPIQATEQFTQTQTSLPIPPAGELSIGAYVQVTGTGGDGLRLRVSPSLQSQVRFLGMESEVFLVKDGPQEVDNYIWWYVVAPLEEARAGWAVANYLRVIQKP